MPHSLTSMWNLKKKKKKKLKPLINTENILVVLRDRGWGLG